MRISCISCYRPACILANTHTMFHLTTPRLEYLDLSTASLAHPPRLYLFLNMHAVSVRDLCLQLSQTCQFLSIARHSEASVSDVTCWLIFLSLFLSRLTLARMAFRSFDTPPLLPSWLLLGRSGRSSVKHHSLCFCSFYSLGN